jgi:signal transduction histidine kinase/DNA-binding response OmpR family regulator
MFGTSLYILRAFGILPNNFITAYSMQIGSALEVILLSLALADRINIIREEKEEAQSLAIDNLHKADRLKDEFLANTSHELKTPLNGIIGITESMIDGATGQVTSAQRARLSMILTSGNRLLYLVNDILDSSRLKHHDISLQLKPVDLRQITELVIILSKPLLAGKSIRLENEISEGIPPVQGDENRLQQIMHNLISNAIKFTDSGIVKMSAVIVDDDLELTVSDTGIGIPKDKLTGIFESFKQADASTSRVYGGTGLGLSITKQLIELHGGTIHAESTVGKGSQFIFTLPVSREQMEPTSKARVAGVRDESAVEDQYAEPPVPIADQLATSDQRSFKILAVDDDPINLQVVVDYLSVQGYEADQVLSGIEALKTVEQDHYDLILLDIMMPGMSGYEVCRKLRENHSANELPVIMLTVKDQVSDLVEGLDAGANDYLTKPISKGELLARVKTHLESASFFKELKRLNKNMDVLLKEFSRIAFKIHNSLKNKLESIRNFITHSIRFHDNKEKLIENLSIANKLIGHCSIESKNILFVITNKECSIKTILEEFELQAELSLPGEQLSYFIHRDDLPEERILKPEVVQYLLDLYTELLNNIVKHSAATRVDITVRCENDQMSLLVKDNGVGFNYETEREKKGSYGLKMIEELNREIGGSLSIDSQSGLGTAAKITVKI